TGRYPAPCPVESGRSSAGSPCGPGRGHPADSPPRPFSRVRPVGVAVDPQLTRLPGRLWVVRECRHLPASTGRVCMGSPTKWREVGRCKGADPDVFYPEDDEDEGAEAKAICEKCPV